MFEPRDRGIVTSFEVTSVTPEQHDGAKVSKVVTITAPIKLPNGQIARKMLVITMERTTGHWIITGITEIGSRTAGPR